MKHKLHAILLIDDDNSCNFIHERLLLNMECTEHVDIAKDGAEGLQILKSSQPKPEIIFLDINMPGMDGWEFLDEYEKLPAEEKSKIIIVMLTSSLNPDDQLKARSYASVSDYCNKYLDKDSVNHILEKFFPELL